MNVGIHVQAILLLTARFSKARENEPRPLSPGEWGRLAQWLKEHRSTPEAFLKTETPEVLKGWRDRSVTLERVQSLLERSGALALAMERWERVGLWVMTRSDKDYPSRLKQRLGSDAPPVFFGCGNRGLLGLGGVAVVGSRDATKDDLVSATTIGQQAASEGHSVVSGGARGVDEAAIVGALEHEGTGVAVLADGLLRAATSAKYRHGLMTRNLVLVSSVYPEAGFDVGNAMARNKYIYCLSNIALVISSTKGKGGTWTGAAETLRRGWVPVWVKRPLTPRSGNADLVQRGARWIPNGDLSLAALIEEPKPGRLDLVPVAGTEEAYAEGATRPADPHSSEPFSKVGEPAVAMMSAGPRSTEVDEERKSATDTDMAAISFYEMFLRRVEVNTAKSPATLADLLTQIDVTKSQLSAWLKSAVAEGRVRKLTKPVRYQWAAHRSGQHRIF